MFARLDSVANGWLTLLLIVWALLLFGGFAFGKLNAEKTRRMPTWTRMASSVALVAAGWSWLAAAAPVGSAALLIAVGMTLGLVGDLFMARKNVIGGIGAFGLGHIAYISALLLYTSAAGLNDSGLRLGAWVAWLVIGVVAWYITVYRGQEHRVLHWAALAYCLLLSSTAGAATGLALQQAAFIPLALGAALFLFSDLLITVQLFMQRSFYLIDDVIWLTYGPAQALIVYSVYAASAVLS
ncbi:MAG: lysoplasmalogenase [Chloroflexi bacterium]|nr:lysoplasmalogenase [Chloroflexota bacterium]